MSLTIYTLDLRAPFIYAIGAATDPFITPIYEEQIACFSIPPDLALSIVPDSNTYLGPLRFTGFKPAEAIAEAIEVTDCTIPKGLYLFAQIREKPERDLFTALAIEVQKEGLWRGLQMEQVVFMRVLKEENAFVTQVLRPLASIPNEQ